MAAPGTPFAGGADAADIIAQPLRSVHALFAHAVSQGIDAVGDSDFGVKAHFEGALAQPGMLEKVIWRRRCSVAYEFAPSRCELPHSARPSQIPCVHLADCKLDLIRPNSLVRFRGMVRRACAPCA